MNNPKLIAELANTHEGSFDYLKKLILSLKDAPAYAVKIQIFTPDELYSKSHENHALFDRLSFSEEEYQEAALMIKEQNKFFYVDIFGSESFEIAKKLKPDAVKIHASDTLNLELIQYALDNFPQIFLSLGGVNLYNLSSVLKFFRGDQPRITLTSGIQSYPTHVKDTHLNRILFLKSHFPKYGICLADHIEGDDLLSKITPALGAYLGADYIEKHVTLDRSRRMNDDHSSLNPDEFIALANSLNQIVELLGPSQLEFTKSDINYKNTVIKKKFLEKGKVIFRRDPDVSTHASLIEPQTGFNKEGVIQRETHEENKVICIVAARTKSSRLPGKCFANVYKDSSALEFLFKRLSKISPTFQVVLATTEEDEDTPIVELAEKYGIKTFRGSSENVLERYLGAARKFQATDLVRCTGDNLFLDEVTIKEVVQHHLHTNAHYTKTVNAPYGASFEVISRSALDFLIKAQTDQSMTEYLTWFLDRKELFNISEYKYSKSDFSNRRLTLDYHEDLKVIQNALKELGPDFSKEELLVYLRSNKVLGNEKIHEEYLNKCFSLKEKINFNLDYQQFINS